MYPLKKSFFFLINLEKVKLIKEFNLDYFYLYTYIIFTFYLSYKGVNYNKCLNISSYFLMTV